MRKMAIVGGASGLAFVLLGWGIYQLLVESLEPRPVKPQMASVPAEEDHPSFLHGRVVALDGTVYEGRLRWGRNQEAFWTDYFNGFQRGNPWGAYVASERLPKQKSSLGVFGLKIAAWDQPTDLGRSFLARFGDIRRIETEVRDLRVTLKSGTSFAIDRFGATDFDDGVRVWDPDHGLIDLGPRQIRTIEFFSRASRSPEVDPAHSGRAPSRLHGTVHTRQGSFTGFLRWDREDVFAFDTLDGQTTDGNLSLPYHTIRSISRVSDDGARVTLLDGREIDLSGTHEVGQGHRGVYVDEERYGRVRISWDAFERVELSLGSYGPAYDDFPPGRPLIGSVTTRDGRRLSGRWVYDLDESETTETLDVGFEGVDYAIPFGRVASMDPAHGEHGVQLTKVTLHNGEELRVEANGDVGEENRGLLVFVQNSKPPEYLPWSEVQRIVFETPTK